MKKLVIQILLYIPLIVIGQTNSFEQLNQAINQHDYDKGLAITENLIKTKQATNLVYYYKACCEQEKNLLDAAIESATTSLKLTTKSDTLYQDILFLRAMTYATAGKIQLGVLDNETLVNEFPNNIDYLLNMSFLYGENQQSDKCLESLHKALRIDSLNIYIINNLAYTYCEIKEYQLAIKYAIKGLALTNDSVWIATLLNSLGFAQAMTISVEKGLQTLNKSLSYNPKNPFAYCNIGLIYAETKNKEKACLNFKIAQQLGGVNLTANYIKQYCE